MTSEKRIWFPGATYHITARGNRRNDIFKNGEDFEVYLTLVKGTLEYYDGKYKVGCYCLMDNHVHILLATSDLHMKEFITRVNSVYAKYFNDKYNYIGHLYQDRYYSELIESDSHMLETSRYIHLNPVRAQMVKRPEEYPWSSYGVLIGKSKNKIIDEDVILSYFHDKNSELYRKFVEEAIETYEAHRKSP